MGLVMARGSVRALVLSFNPTRAGFAAWAYAALLAAALVQVGLSVGPMHMSVDSWSYLELARSLASGHYNFVTVRSYVSDGASVSFPFGYPLVLAAWNGIFGWSAQGAIILNGAVAGASVLLAWQLGSKLRLPAAVSLGLATALVLNPFYLDEVFSGRAVPLALLVLLASGLAGVARQWLAAGLLAGLAALVRLDFLVHGALLLLATGWLLRPGLRAGLTLLMGFFLGILPWVVYSIAVTGGAWASESGWLALAAYPGRVYQFPAEAAATVFTHPQPWAERVLGNIHPVLVSAGKAAAATPSLWFLLPLLMWAAVARPAARKHAAVLLALLGLSLSPYILTGFSAERYFVPALFALALLAATLGSGVRPVVGWLVLSASLALGAPVLYSFTFGAETKLPAHAAQDQVLARLSACHAQYPGVTLMFPEKTHLSGARYGAQFRRPAALAPAGYARMPAARLANLGRWLGAYEYLDGTGPVGRCADIAPPPKRQRVPAG